MRYTTGHDRTGHRYVHNSIKVLTITSYFHHTFITFSAYTIIVRRNRTTKFFFITFSSGLHTSQYAVLFNCLIPQIPYSANAFALKKSRLHQLFQIAVQLFQIRPLIIRFLRSISMLQAVCHKVGFDPKASRRQIFSRIIPHHQAVLGPQAMPA